MIAEKDIDCVFNAHAIAELAKYGKLPADTDLTRFGENIRLAAHSYFAERGRTDWKNIGRQIGELYRLIDKADRGGETAAAQLAGQIGSIDHHTRRWLEQCVLRPTSFPSPDEIMKSQTRRAAVNRLRRILSYGLQRFTDRKRPTGKRSISIEPLLRTPQMPREPGDKGVTRASDDQPPKRPRTRRGRLRDTAVREFVQCLALAYLEATGRSPPRRVNLQSQGPFFRLVFRCFSLARIPTGSVADLINERESNRQKLAKRPVTLVPHEGTCSAF